MKLFLLFLILNSYLFSSSQIIFVLSNNDSSSKAKLIRYEKINNIFKKISNPIDVNLGAKGLAWGTSDLFKINANKKNLKKEGDKKAVIGVFKLSSVYGYAKNNNIKMPYTQSTKDLICVDDISSKDYNQIIKIKDKRKYKSYENMLLKNDVYEYVIKIEHNPSSIKSKGSCIFMHVQNSKKSSTLGCTSMAKNDIKEILSWLDIKKEPILIQVDKFSCKEMKKKYSFLQCNL